MPRSISNIEVIKQLIRAATSVGANYIEANEALGRKDFRMRIKICRKEAKEANYWLKLIDVGNSGSLAKEGDSLVQEATELVKIFSSIVEKTR